MTSSFLPDDDISRSSAADLSERLRRGEVSSREIVAHYLDRIGRLDPDLHAFVVIDDEGARQAADEADRRRAAGNELGPLDGVPVAIKDCFEVRGLSVTAGAEERRGLTCEHDAPAVAALRRAGAVVLGTTSTPWMLSDIQTHNSFVGVTNNPWDADRSAGGSSGGSAAALAAGLAPLSLASDLAGSIRIPSAWCGVPGMKPSFGIVSKRGHIPGADSTYPVPDVSVTGPMGRSVADLELALDVLVGPDPERAVAWRLDLPPPRERDAVALRYGVWSDDPASPAGAEVATALTDVCDRLTSMGCRLTSVRTSRGLEELAEVFTAVVTGEMSANYPLELWRQIAAGVDWSDPDAATHDHLLAQPHRMWVAHEARRQALQAEVAALFDEVDVILAPVTPGPAILHDVDRPVEQRTYVLDGNERPYDDLMRWSAIATVASTPSVVVPTGTTTSGLPVAVQVIGPYLEDRTALLAAALVEQVSRRP